MLRPAIFLWFDVPKGVVLKQSTVFTHAKTVGNRAVDFEHFARNAEPLVLWKRIERFHVVHAICKLNKNHAHIARHCHEHLTEIFQIALLPAILHVAEFGDGAHH